MLNCIKGRCSRIHFATLSLALSMAIVMAVSVCTAADQRHARRHNGDVTTLPRDIITKAEFVGRIVDYFGWPHPDDYNDVWKTPLKQFNDVETTDPFGRQIESAYEENIIEADELGNFYPHDGITREDAAVIFAEAFKIPVSGTATTFSDNDTISPEAVGSVNALVELDCMTGRTAKLFKPQELLRKSEFFRIFTSLQGTVVAPAYALPRQNYSAPRRYVKMYCATPGATIYYTTDGSTPTTESEIYTVADKGHLNEALRTDQLPERDVVYKAITVKDGMVPSEVQTFTWHLYRPILDDFQAELILEATETSPAVYQIYNDSESVRAMAWYIEGSESGILFDALQTSADVLDLVDFIDIYLASKPFSLVIGHEHGDHDAQAPNFIDAGLDVYLNERGWASTATAGWFPALFDTPEEQAKVKNIEEGDVIDLGNCEFHVFAMPGHANGNIVIQDKVNGLIFSSDIYGCTRAGSADNVNVSGLRVDRLLSFTQQTYSNYKKNGGKTTMLFTGHDESALADINLRLFEAALQQVVDNGEAGCSPTLRGNNDAPYSRTTLIGDMWADGTNWIALKIGGIMGDDYEYLTSEPINYNGDTGYMRYSVLSNIEIEGGELVGKTVTWADARTFDWAGETITVENSLPNKFDPWSYDYTITIPAGTESITVIPTTMSTKVHSIRLNGKLVDYRSENTVAVADGTCFTIKIVAPDKKTTSTYTFTVAAEN